MRSFSAAALGTVLMVLIVASGRAHADMIVVQRVDGEGKTGEMRIEIKGSKVRIDLSPQITILRETASGEEWTLLRDRKAFLRVTPQATAALHAEMANGRAATPPAKLVATGRSEKIGGQDAQIFTAETGNLKATYWIAARFPHGAELLAQMKVLERGSVAELSRGLLPSVADLPGFPIKTEMILQDRKTTTTILDAHEEALADDRFAIPLDYHELASPYLPPKEP